MPYDPSRHHRRSIRLPGYDYSQPGAYFVTLCAHGRQRLFGVSDGAAVQRSDAGQMIARWWLELNRKFPTIRTDAFVVMPDHFHGIVVILDAGAAGAVGDVGEFAYSPLHDDAIDAIDAASVRADLYIRPATTGEYANSPLHDDFNGPIRPSLPTIMQWFKIMTTTEYIRNVKQSSWPPFDRRVWQRGYWERIVRDERERANVQRYITENPQRHAARRAALDALLARMTYHDQ